MLIKKLIIKNFRQYIGVQEIEFSIDKEKNVTVLIGINTSGKTTFVRAFEWILYNKIGFEDDILLNKNVVDNMCVGETQNVIGTIILIHENKEFEITRKYTYTCTAPKTVRHSLSDAKILYLQADGQTKTEIGSDFKSNIEGILPEALSSYFFFGGERVGSISSREDIEASVKGLMGLDVLSNAMGHLRTVINRLKKGMDFSGDQTAQNIQQKLDGKNKQLETYSDELQNFDEQIEYYQSEKTKYAALLKANEPTANDQKRREQLECIINDLEKRIEKDKNDLVSTFSINAFSFFSAPLLKKVIEVLNDAGDDTDSVPEMTAASIDFLLSRGKCICGTNINEGSAAEQNLLRERAKQPPEFIGDLVRRYKEQAVDYLSSSENYAQNVTYRYANIRANQRELGFRLDEKKTIDKSLEGQKDSSGLEQEYKRAEIRLKQLDNDRSRMIESRGACKKDIANYEKSLEAYSKANEKNAKVTTCISYATATFDWVRYAYQSKESIVRGRLEEKVNHNFSKMYHGSRNIIIDEKYRVKYYDVTTEESDGLKSVKSFAFISGLVDLAKEALSAGKDDEASIGPQYYPLVMDAPFSNVDEIHIKNISQILPKSAEQVIIAVMQKDWEPAAEIMASVIGKTYSIIKDKNAEGIYIDTLTHIKEENKNV